MAAEKILITGGIRSGKSAYSLKLAQNLGSPKIFLATAKALDGDMTTRIKNHQQERGEAYQTIEESLHIDAQLQNLPKDTSVVVIDCLTLWVNNLMYRLKEDEHKIHNKISNFLSVLKTTPINILMVTNEVGLGVIPENKMARRYIDFLGRLNQQVAEISDEVILMVSGIPQKIKKRK